MPKAKMLDGMRFGRLTAIKYLYTVDYGTQGKSHRVYLCKCDCGNDKLVTSNDLVRGNVKSCGCLAKETLNSFRGTQNIKHGMSNTRLASCYYRMRRRCSHEKNWKDRGIKVCEEWANNPKSFFDWALSHGYDDSLTLDRIDVNGDYCPENCRWATSREQANNKTNNHYVTICDITHTIAEWSRISGVSPATISKRIEHGYPEEELLAPVGANYYTDKKNRKTYFHYITINGETHTITEWSNISGLTRSCILARLKAGWSEEELFADSGTVYHGNRLNNFGRNKRVCNSNYEKDFEKAFESAVQKANQGGA